jgi:membrane protein YqaA with SNARE-associated domain
MLFLLLISSWITLSIRFGWAGIIALGIIDASVLPLPGSLDVLTIVLASHKHAYWLLYAVAAWVGSVGGGYLTFRLGQKGGKELLEKRVPKRGLQRVSRWMEHHSSLSLFLPTLLPPPTPVSYFVLAAGAMQVSLRTFFLSFGAGRAIRYLLLAYFGSRYGRQMLHWARVNYVHFLIALLSLAVLAAIILAAWWFNKRPSKQQAST